MSPPCSRHGGGHELTDYAAQQWHKLPLANASEAVAQAPIPTWLSDIATATWAFCFAHQEPRAGWSLLY
jgi:hypothetical protein